MKLLKGRYYRPFSSVKLFLSNIEEDIKVIWYQNTTKVYISSSGKAGFIYFIFTRCNAILKLSLQLKCV